MLGRTHRSRPPSERSVQCPKNARPIAPAAQAAARELRKLNECSNISAKRSRAFRTHGQEELAQVLPSCANVGPMSDNSGKSWAEFGQTWPKSVRNLPKSASVGFRPGLHGLKGGGQAPRRASPWRLRKPPPQRNGHCNHGNSKHHIARGAARLPDPARGRGQVESMVTTSSF